jgi:hypothetical protein
MAKTPISDQLVHDAARAPQALQHAKAIQAALSGNSAGPEKIFRDPLEDADISPIAFSTAKLLRDVRGGGTYIIDPIQYDSDGGADLNLIIKDVRALAQKLRLVDDSKFGMLQCRAVLRTRRNHSAASYDFLFRTPAGSGGAVTTLRALLISGRQHSLSERLRIGQQLARAVCYIHTLQFVHKNICPEAILSFEQGNAPLGLVFLVGFEMFRNDGGHTYRRGDSDWEKNIYRHPDRQGLSPEKRHVMQHDIYSLGVCLLEIGLWTPLVGGSNDSVEGSMSGLKLDQSKFLSPDLIKETLVGRAKCELPSRMGDRYSDVVVNCLTCLDPDNLDFADTHEFEDDDEVSISVKYIEKVRVGLQTNEKAYTDRYQILSKMEDICL